jgi:hypothetical protein
MLNGIYVLFANIAIRIWFSAFVPLLPKYCLAKTTLSKTSETNLVAHQALCLRSARIPFLKVSLLTFAFSGPGKVELDDDDASDILCLVFPRYLPQKHELLRGGVGEGHERPRSEFDANVVFQPVGKVSIW